MTQFGLSLRRSGRSWPLHLPLLIGTVYDNMPPEDAGGLTSRVHGLAQGDTEIPLLYKLLRG